MRSLIPFFLSTCACILCLLISLTSATNEAAPAPNYITHKCSNKTFTPNSTFQSNLNFLLVSLHSKSYLTTGFYNDTIGRNSRSDNDTVYGFFLCRGDVAATDVCENCVATANMDAIQRCPNRKGIVIWYDECMLRYSDKPFFSTAVNTPRNFLRSSTDAMQPPVGFNQVLETTMNQLLTKAAANNTNGTVLKYFATEEGQIKGFNNDTLYSLGQCTPDLSSADCKWCLEEAVGHIVSKEYQGGRFLYPSCYIRYQLSPFYGTAIDEVFPPILGYDVIILVVFVLVVLVLVCELLVLLCYCFIRRRATAMYNARPQEKVRSDINDTVESLQFDLGTLKIATNKFSDDNKLGEGGFGKVFKGILGSGQEIAVKRLSKNSGQGVEEFKNEVILVAKLQHRNLVRLLGFCLEGKETILVYEYVPNKSLDYFLFEPDKRKQLDWSRRCTIIEGIARGILYLHEDSRLRIVHRDLKASNILLDGDMNPKVSDFGMAKMFGIDQTQGNTRRIVGTYGYMAPEYAMEGLYSIKSDVFSFGILLLEILTGRRNFLGFHLTNCAPTLIAHVWQLWNEGKGLELMDPLLKDSCRPNEFVRYIHIGLLCVQEGANDRPNMSSVVLALKGETRSLSRPERPAFFTGRTTNHRDQVEADHNCSANGLTISSDVPR